MTSRINDLYQLTNVHFNVAVQPYILATHQNNMHKIDLISYEETIDFKIKHIS